MRELPTTAPHEGLWVLYALRAAFTGRRDPRRRTRSRTRQLINRRDTAEMESLGLVLPSRGLVGQTPAMRSYPTTMFDRRRS
jgi:hypothetical protein